MTVQLLLKFMVSTCQECRRDVLRCKNDCDYLCRRVCRDIPDLIALEDEKRALGIQNLRNFISRNGIHRMSVKHWIDNYHEINLEQFPDSILFAFRFRIQKFHEMRQRELFAIASAEFCRCGVQVHSRDLS